MDVVPGRRLIIPLIALVFSAYHLQRRVSISALEHASLVSIIPVAMGSAIGVLLGMAVFPLSRG